MTRNISVPASGASARKCTVFWLIAILIFVVYANTIDDEFHFDDIPNIVRAKNVHIKYPTFKELKKSTIKQKTERLYRPVARVSLALNWYFGGKDVTGYHLVNIAVHILACFFLYLSILLILQAPRASDISPEYRQFIALLAAVLWATNPIQTQAVTYIIQRMASMAGLFYIMGIFFYLRARLGTSRIKEAFLYSGVLFCFLFAVGSKENAIVFPLGLLLIEVCFFQDMIRIRNKRFALYSLASLAGLLLAGTALFWIMRDNPLQYFGDLAGQYEDRPFTLGQRLLTEPRVVLFYLSQIFYPIADRLSLVHDFPLSTSLFSPWTTFVSILTVFGAIIFCLLTITKFRFLSFAVLFFFINHAVEASIFPLELVFEHRNYLPSMFLFLPVALALARGINYYKTRGKKPTQWLLVSFAALLIFLFSTGTYVRNMAWANDKILWEDAIEKAPNSARPHNNLALLVKKYDPKRAESLFKMVEKGTPVRKDKNKILAYTNLAYMYLQEGKYEQSEEYYNKLLKYDPDSEKGWMGLISCYLQVGDLGKALRRADMVLEDNPDHQRVLGLKSFILLRMNRPDQAYPVVKKYLGMVPDDKKALLNMVCVLHRLEKYNRARSYLDRLLRLYPGDLPARLFELESHLAAGEEAEARTCADRLLKQFPLARIGGYFADMDKKGGMVWLVDKGLLLPFLQQRLKGRGDVLLSGGSAKGRGFDADMVEGASPAF
ncbi:MAG: tetratricopeptide repeat protein [Desulfonatronovibrionaceae bacterium]